MSTPALSTYKGYLRELTTKTIDQIFNALSSDNFLYLLAIMKGGQRFLEAVEPSLADERLQDDLDFQYKVFSDLALNIAKYCDTEQYESLLCLIADGRRAAKNLSQSVTDES